jgi:regulator of replication initiation timing
MIFSIVKATQEIKSLKASITDLSAEVEQLKTENEKLKQQSATFVLSSQDFVSEKETLVKGHEDEKNKLKATYETQIKDLEKSVKEAQESSSQKASIIVASIGLEPDTIKTSVGDIINNKPQTDAGKHPRVKVISHLNKK